MARSNAWVAVAAADGPHRLGISDEAATGELSARMTGFWPGLNVQAPSAAFAIQQHEVSWAELEAAGDSVGGLAGLHRPSWVPADAAKRANLPATGVPWHVARAWCRAVGGDLPSEAQWEWAARGPDARPFPWGRDALDTTRIRIQLKRPIPVAAVGTSPQDVTPGAEPVRDLLGNAQEWTRDAWTPSRPGETVDKGDAPHHRAVRGWPLTERGARLPAEGASYRQAMCVTGACDQDAAATDLVGFRCVKPLP
ncbi:MAG: SUMF1/EgtB/PvdO family nonheme iron enzyme [Myxococcota bacterium]